MIPDKEQLCKESPYCNDDKCFCEEYYQQVQYQGKVIEFHQAQMEALSEIIRKQNEV